MVPIVTRQIPLGDQECSRTRIHLSGVYYVVRGPPTSIWLDGASFPAMMTVGCTIGSIVSVIVSASFVRVVSTQSPPSGRSASSGRSSPRAVQHNSLCHYSVACRVLDCNRKRRRSLSNISCHHSVCRRVSVYVGAGVLVRGLSPTSQSGRPSAATCHSLPEQHTNRGLVNRPSCSGIHCVLGPATVRSISLLPQSGTI